MSLLNLACMGLSGALMAAAVLAVRAVALHRLPKQAFVVLWALVALRLLVPVWAPSPLSAFGPVQERVTAFAEEHASLGATSWLAGGGTDGAELAAGENAGSGTTGGADGTSGAHAEPSGAAESTGADGTAAPTADSAAVDGLASAAGQTGATGQAAGASAAATPSPTPATPASGNAGPALSPATVAVCIWALGTVGFAAFFTAVYLHARWDFRTSLPVADPRARAWLAARLPNPRVSVRVSDRVGTPLTYGIARPVVLMPASTDWADTERLAFVLDHELAHIRRHDALLKPLFAAAVCLHWWNPLAWAMFALANRDIELACDEAVLRAYPRDRRAAYARTLVSLEEHRDLPALVYTAFSRTAIEERIGAIMRTPHRSVAALIASGLLIVGIPTALATAAQPVISAEPAGPVRPVANDPGGDAGETAPEDGAEPETDPELASLIDAYGDEEWQRLRDFLGAQFALEYGTVNDTTIAQFRTAARETFGTDEGQDLLARLAADDELRAWATAYAWDADTSSDVATVALTYYGLLPLASDSWENATFEGAVEIPADQAGGTAATLAYQVTVNLLDDPESIALWAYPMAALWMVQQVPELVAALPASVLGDPNAAVRELQALTEELLAAYITTPGSVVPVPSYTYTLDDAAGTSATALFSYLASDEQLRETQLETTRSLARTLVASYRGIGLEHEVVEHTDGTQYYSLSYEGTPVGRVYDTLYGMAVTDYLPAIAAEDGVELVVEYASGDRGPEPSGLHVATAGEIEALMDAYPLLPGDPGTLVTGRPATEQDSDAAESSDPAPGDPDAAGGAASTVSPADSDATTAGSTAYTEEEWRLIADIYDQVKDDEDLTLEGFADLLVSIGYLDNPATVDLRNRLSADQAAFGGIADNELASFIHNTLVPLSYPGSPAHFQATAQRAVDLPGTDGEAIATLDYTLSVSPANDLSATTVSEWTAIVTGTLAAVADALDQAPADYLSDAELMRYAFGGLVAERMPAYSPSINLVLSGQYSYNGQDGAIVGSPLVPYTLSGSSSPAYPVNENGQTYGSEADALSFAPNGTFTLDSLPDLVSVVGINGRAGYVYKEELHTPTPANPEEALAMMESDALGPREIDVYAVDGETVVDTFIVNGSSAAPASQTED